jgi:hypothetical protein
MAAGIELEPHCAPSEPAGEILSTRQRAKNLLNLSS